MPCPTTGCSRSWPATAGRPAVRHDRPGDATRTRSDHPARDARRRRRDPGDPAPTTATTARIAARPDIVGPYVRHLIRRGPAASSRSTATRSSASARRSTPAAAATSPTCSSDRDRLGRGHRPAAARRGSSATDWPRTTFASDDPRAMPLYVRAGMTPLWPSLYVAGPASGAPGADRGGFDAEPADRRAARGARARLDRRRSLAPTTRSGRPRPDADPFVVRRRRRRSSPSATRGRRQPGRAAAVLDRLVVRADAEPLAADRSRRCASRAARAGEIAACFRARTRRCGRCSRSGFRIVDRDTFMASEPDLVDPDRRFARLRERPRARTGGRQAAGQPDAHGPSCGGHGLRGDDGVGFSIGTPTMLPHSVQLPS